MNEETEVAYRSGQRFVARLDVVEHPTSEVQFKPEACYLVIIALALVWRRPC